jgi:hypothetical protein
MRLFPPITAARMVAWTIYTMAAARYLGVRTT